MLIWYHLRNKNDINHTDTIHPAFPAFCVVLITDKKRKCYCYKNIMYNHTRKQTSDIGCLSMRKNMMTSSNGNIFRVTGHLCGEFIGPRWIPTQRPVARSFDVYFDLRPNKRLSKHSWGRWFETLSSPLWRHHNELSSSLNQSRPCGAYISS